MFDNLLEKIMEVTAEEELIEKLTALEHEQWAEWAKSILKSENISKEREERWGSLFVPYEELSEDMKEMDRKYARKVLKVLKKKE